MHVSKLTTQNLHSHKLNDGKSIVQNFKTVVQSQMELQSCKVGCEYIRPLIANLVTYNIYIFILQQIRHYTSSNKRLLQVPRDSYCVISIAYDIPCQSEPTSSALLLCNTTSDDDNNGKQCIVVKLMLF